MRKISSFHKNVKRYFEDLLRRQMSAERALGDILRNGNRWLTSVGTS